MTVKRQKEEADQKSVCWLRSSAIVPRDMWAGNEDLAENKNVFLAWVVSEFSERFAAD